jgi:hypothetical protein
LISKTAPALFTLVRSNFSCNSASVKISCVSPLPGFHPRSATKLIRHTFTRTVSGDEVFEHGKAFFEF